MNTVDSIVSEVNVARVSTIRLFVASNVVNDILSSLSSGSQFVYRKVICQMQNSSNGLGTNGEKFKDNLIVEYSRYY